MISGSEFGFKGIENFCSYNPFSCTIKAESGKASNGIQEYYYPDRQICQSVSQ